MSSNNTGSDGGRSATHVNEPATTAPASAVVVLREAGVGKGARLQAELDGRMDVGTQVLIIEMEEVQIIGTGELNSLANAATRLQQEHSGSMVLRHTSTRLLGQLRLMHLDHMFELEI